MWAAISRESLGIFYWFIMYLAYVVNTVYQCVIVFVNLSTFYCKRSLKVSSLDVTGGTELVNFCPVFCNKFISFIGIPISIFAGSATFFRIHFKVGFDTSSCGIKSHQIR